MNKLIVVLSVLFVTACQPDTTELEDTCTQVVKDGLATCTQDAWQLCDEAYSKIMGDMEMENARLREDLVKFRNMYEAGCGGFVNGAVNDFMSTAHCTYDPANPDYWACDDSYFCQGWVHAP